MALSGTVFIDRGNRQTAIKAFDGAVKEIKGNKQSVWIFPVCTLCVIRWISFPDDEIGGYQVVLWQT